MAAKKLYSGRCYGRGLRRQKLDTVLAGVPMVGGVGSKQNDGVGGRLCDRGRWRQKINIVLAGVLMVGGVGGKNSI